MADFEDIKLDKTPALATPPPSRALPLAIILIVLIAIAGGWYYLGRTSKGDQSVAVRSDRIVPDSGSASSPAVNPDLPPLDESDDLVRELVSALSRHPIIAAWLTTDQLIRTFAVSLMNVADGNTPAGHLGVIRPERRFQTRQRGSRTYIDPRSYSRFDAHAAAVSSLDPQGAAGLYTRLRPRIQEAYREFAGANADVDRAVQRAIVMLLATPVVEGEIPLESRPVGFAYADPSLESLSRAQQQLLRMGPQNVRLVQQQLRAIARHLGIDEASLPRERVIQIGR
jgi:hypothetical protein